MGVLLVDMKNEPRIYSTFFRREFVGISKFFIEKFYGDTADVYDRANQDMLAELLKKKQPDGELNFFAVDPEIKGKGLGTLMLDELQRLEAGKFIYLYTDSGSTYQFYHRRGFEESVRRDVTLRIKGGTCP